MAPSRVRTPPSPLAQRPPRVCAHARRGGRAVECGGLENRYPSLGGSRVQIPPPPLHALAVDDEVGEVRRALADLPPALDLGPDEGCASSVHERDHGDALDNGVAISLVEALEPAAV